MTWCLFVRLPIYGQYSVLLMIDIGFLEKQIRQIHIDKF